MNKNKILDDLGIQITNSAISYFEFLLTSEPKNTNIRISVSDPGTIYADFRVAFCSQNLEELSDLAVKFEKFTIFIEESSLPFLKDAKIDFLPDEADEQLSINAPNLKNDSNDKRTLAEKIQCVIDNEINPILASHGGMIALEDVLEGSIALLRFGGGCRGCMVADVTFRQTVESILKQHFPELKEIRNITDHIEQCTKNY